MYLKENSPESNEIQDAYIKQKKYKLLLMIIAILNNKKNSIFLPLSVHQQIQAKMITMLHKILLVEYHPVKA